MKIAVIGPAYPARGGIAQYTPLLAAQHATRLDSHEEDALYFAAADLVVLPYREARRRAVVCYN